MIKDLKNVKFGVLTVVDQVEGKRKEGQTVWLCRCECGKLLEVGRKDLVKGRKKSCGCKRVKTIMTERCIICNKEEKFILKNKVVNREIVCLDCFNKLYKDLYKRLES